MPTVAKVDAANAYRQIITNFSNSLEFVREAISNSIDARASRLSAEIDQVRGPTGMAEICVILRDDGHGMDERTLERFFNLGDSEKSELKNDVDQTGERLIGEKGFGTKIYLNSRKVEVRTKDKNTGISYIATSEGHLERIYSGGQPPQFEVTKLPSDDASPGTEVRIFGYNHNDGSKLGHDQVLDYIVWFTKFASIEPLLWPTSSRHEQTKTRLGGLTLQLHGLGFDAIKHAKDPMATASLLQFGHPFPEQCFDGKALREKAKTRKASPSDFYCRWFVKEGSLKGFPAYRWQAVFSIEGNRTKYDANPMIRRQRYIAPAGAYKVA